MHHDIIILRQPTFSCDLANQLRLLCGGSNILLYVYTDQHIVAFPVPHAGIRALTEVTGTKLDSNLAIHTSLASGPGPYSYILYTMHMAISVL